MKTLIAYYSKTGNTKKIAKAIANEIECDIEEIIDLVNKEGVIGYLKSGMQAILKKDTRIKDSIYNLKEYDLIIIGTPVWAFTVSTPVRTYILQNSMHFNKVAFFCTEGSTGSKNTFKEMASLCNKKPIATIQFTVKEVKDESYSQKIKEFINKIRKSNYSYPHSI